MGYGNTSDSTANLQVSKLYFATVRSLKNGGKHLDIPDKPQEILRDLSRLGLRNADAAGSSVRLENSLEWVELKR